MRNIGYECNNGTCRVSCSQNGHCAQGYVCSSQQCVQAKTCTSDADCNGYECNNGTCRVSCWQDNHCAQGYHCTQGSCVAD